ncbi:MAG: hypothetical protein LC785_18485 [Acidobacteria bacterium]|nr:hypothetical protein [Acidobacteriota bacterium]
MLAASVMWDTKRQIIWLTTGVVLGTFFLYPLARDEVGVTDWSYFAQLELLLLAVIGVMFYVYSKKNRG